MLIINPDCLKYLPTAEAVVINFLAPIGACLVCSMLLGQPFTRKERIAGIVSLLGVVLIARPTSFFTSQTFPSSVPTSVLEVDTTANTPAAIHDNPGIDGGVTTIQRVAAIGVGLIGVCGTVTAYTTIRWIGNRAHPLISVNYYAVWCTIISALALLVIPGIDFRLPTSFFQWSLLSVISISGFAMQLLLTAGLAYEKSSRSTNMIYTSILFALIYDGIVFHAIPQTWSLVGSLLIMGSAIYVAMQNDNRKIGERTEVLTRDEEVGLIAGAATLDQTDDEEERQPMEVQEVQDIC